MIRLPSNNSDFLKESERFIACAKINLGLEVLFRRPDGYHELNTLFYRVLEPHDTLVVTASDSFEFSCSDAKLSADTSNLALVAAHRFAEATKTALPAMHVHLEKAIPMGAGLGGGSSDAAAMLHILQERSVNPLSTEALHRLGVSLGADVPFFLSGDRAAIASGIGEKLRAIELSVDSPILIVKDNETSVSTKEAYANLELIERPVPTDLVAPFSTGQALQNDFERSLFKLHPKLGVLKQQLYDAGATRALMSGSGAALFGLFDSLESAANAEQVFRAKGIATFINP